MSSTHAYTTIFAAYKKTLASILPPPPGRNHVFKVGGPIPWSRVLLPFYRKKLDRSTQFGAIGYIITPYSSKSNVKSWGSVKILGRSGPPDHPVVAPTPPEHLSPDLHAS